MGRSTPTSGTVIPTPITGAGVRSCAARGSVNAATAQNTTNGVAFIGPFRSGVRVDVILERTNVARVDDRPAAYPVQLRHERQDNEGAEDDQCVRGLFSRANPWRSLT